jgi:hypothetical protein
VIERPVASGRGDNGCGPSTEGTRTPMQQPHYVRPHPTAALPTFRDRASSSHGATWSSTLGELQQ